MVDVFRDQAASLKSPARSAAVVTPNDFANLPVASRALYVGVQGDLTVELVDEGVVTFTEASGLVPICVRRVLATGTAASSILALW